MAWKHKTAFLSFAVATVSYLAPGPFSQAEQSQALSKSSYVLANNNAGIRWTVKSEHLQGLTLLDQMHHRAIPASYAFRILLKDGTVYDESNLRLTQSIQQIDITPVMGSARLAGTIAGQTYTATLENAGHSLRAVWTVILLKDAPYIRQELTLQALTSDVAVDKVELIDLKLPGSHVEGAVQGSPIVTDTEYFAFEHPISESRVSADQARAWIDRTLPLRSGQSVTYSCVFGVVHQGQMRREFQAYIEQERAHPYRTFLHPNSWYDLGYFTPYDQKLAVNRIDAFGQELVQKRNVKIDSYLFDDGWDNHRTLWKFNDGFPNGFTPIRDELAKFQAAPGVWMSPWGGYSTPKKERIEFGTKSGYEIVKNGYALSGPKYYAAFRDVCIDMIRRYGINQFKIDGTGNVNSVYPGSQFDSDFSAAINLIGELRSIEPNLFVNLTTGTWPSPFWLRYSDTIWRGGEDDDFAGVGSFRERWITYRDADTYQRIVQRGPLFPLNSLMLHGIIYARFHKHLNEDPQNDFRNEVRSYFGTGTQLQELYITPELLSQQNWDDLAEAAKWSRANQAILKDTHWVGGDPAWLEPYGWAAWSPAKSIITLRNPSDKSASISLKLGEVLELPMGTPTIYSAKSPWHDSSEQTMRLDVRQPHTFKLAPFEVLTLELRPQ